MYSLKKRTAAYSPDLNIIELVWHDLKDFIRKQVCRDIVSLILAIRVFEAKLTPEYCRRFINHLNKVLDAIIRENGDWSDH